MSTDGGARGRRAGVTGLALVTVVLAGCGSAPAGTSAAASSGGTSAAVSSAAAASVAEVQYAANTPPPAALLLCSTDVRAEVIADALNVASVPAPQSTWADHVYTCTYGLPMGRLVLAVTVAPTLSAARDDLQTMRGQLGATQQEPGLGQQAYSTAGGTVIAVKDNMVLRVDATGMPDDLGNTHEHRLDFARVIAAGVFDCWAGG